MSSGWLALAPCPKQYCAAPVLLNENELMVAIDIAYGSDTVDDDGIYTYNIVENKWKLLIPYPTHYTVTCPSICYDCNKQLLYVYGFNNRCLLIVDLIQKRCIVRRNLRELGWYPKAIMIENELNIICGAKNKYHLKWDEKLQTFERMYHFQQLREGNANPGVVYLKSKNMIILFGGADRDDTVSNEEGVTNINTVWKYSICEENCDKEWSKMDLLLPKPANVFGYALSTDEKYIFILGGRTYHNSFTKDVDDIYVIDTEKWRIMKSKIRCPMKSPYHCCLIAMKASNNYLATGYIQQFCLLFGLIIPLEIIHLISSMCYDDYIHLLKSDGHWKINTNHIIQELFHKKHQ